MGFLKKEESACVAGDTDSIPGSGRAAGEGIGYPLQYSWASLVDQLVKNLPAVVETWVRPLGWEDPLENGKATHSRILAWRIPWIVHGIAESRTRLSDFHFTGSPLLFEGFLELGRVGATLSVCGLLIAAASLTAEVRLQVLPLQYSGHVDSVLVEHLLSYSLACGIFLDRGLNLCPLHWQADSSSPHHQGSLHLCFLFWFVGPEALWDPSSLTRDGAPTLVPGTGRQSLNHRSIREALVVWVDQMVKNLPAVRETRVQSLGQEEPLEEEMATHSTVPAWRIPRTEEPGGLQSQRVRHD